MGCNQHTPNPGTDHPLVALWRDLLAASAAFNAHPTEDSRERALWSRLRAIEKKIEDARPDDLTGLAVQLRYLQRWLDIGWSPDQGVLIDAIAATLAKLGGVEVPADPDIRHGGDAS